MEADVDQAGRQQIQRALQHEQPPTHLNDIFRADTGETRQFWALPYVPGPRYLDRPVYVLTSGRTFSGGEDFAYTLQALGRAQVIGETTGGGAHPTRPFGISAAVPADRGRGARGAGDGHGVTCSPSG